MATVKVCDKCGERVPNQGNRLIVFVNREHINDLHETYFEIEKCQYDLCEKCGIELARQVDEYVDATILDCNDE